MGPSWEQKSIKNHFKNEVRSTMHLGIDFLSILFGFGSQVGSKLALKMDQKSMQKCIEKSMQKQQQQNVKRSTLEASLACPKVRDVQRGTATQLRRGCGAVATRLRRRCGGVAAAPVGSQGPQG